MTKHIDRPDTNIVSLVPKSANGDAIISIQVKELLAKLTELNDAGGLTSLCVIGIRSGGVLTAMASQDPSLTLLGAITVGTSNIMDEIYDELEEVELPPSK